MSIAIQYNIIHVPFLLKFPDTCPDEALLDLPHIKECLFADIPEDYALLGGIGTKPDVCVSLSGTDSYFR